MLPPDCWNQNNLSLISYEISKLIEFVQKTYHQNMCMCCSLRFQAGDSTRLFKLSVYTHQFSQVILARPTMHAQSDLQFHQCSPNNITKSMKHLQKEALLCFQSTHLEIKPVGSSLMFGPHKLKGCLQGLWPALKPILNHLSSLKPTTPTPQNFPSQAASNIDSYKNIEKKTPFISNWICITLLNDMSSE